MIGWFDEDYDREAERDQQKAGRGVWERVRHFFTFLRGMAGK